MEDYQTYLPDMLWESREALGKSLVKFNKMDMRELLENALTKVHESRLQRIDWEILDKDYKETVSKLKSMEPTIIQDNAMEKRLSSIEDTVGKRGNSNSSGNSNGYTKCKTCGKTHPGECRMKSSSKRKDGKQSYKE